LWKAIGYGRETLVPVYTLLTWVGFGFIEYVPNTLYTVPSARSAVRQDSTRSNEGDAITEESSAATQMEEIFQRLMKLTGKKLLLF
jgi:hypothetical protein